MCDGTIKLWVPFFFFFLNAKQNELESQAAAVVCENNVEVKLQPSFRLIGIKAVLSEAYSF